MMVYSPVNAVSDFRSKTSLRRPTRLIFNVNYALNILNLLVLENLDITYQ